MIKHIPLAIIQFIVLFILKFVAIILGFLIVPIALLFRTTKNVPETGRQVYPSRRIVHLP